MDQQTIKKTSKARQLNVAQKKQADSDGLFGVGNQFWNSSKQWFLLKPHS